MLVPVWNTPMPVLRNGWRWRRAISRICCATTPFDLTGMPALTMNGGFDKRGAPIGFQLAGKHLSEDLLLRAGQAFQSITDWHTRHPALD